MSGRARALLVLAALALGAATCETDPCRDDARASGNEPLHLNVSGSCVSVPRQIELQDVFCRLTLSAPGGGAPYELPAQGEADQAGHTVREGGWTIYGDVDLCAPRDESCTRPKQFRRCTATRVDWQVDLACVDSSGAPVCQAVLTE